MDNERHNDSGTKAKLPKISTFSTRYFGKLLKKNTLYVCTQLKFMMITLSINHKQDLHVFSFFLQDFKRYEYHTNGSFILNLLVNKTPFECSIQCFCNFTIPPASQFQQLLAYFPSKSLLLFSSQLVVILFPSASPLVLMNLSYFPIPPNFSLVVLVFFLFFIKVHFKGQVPVQKCLQDMCLIICGGQGKPIGCHCDFSILYQNWDFL